MTSRPKSRLPLSPASTHLAPTLQAGGEGRGRGLCTQWAGPVTCPGKASVLRAMRKLAPSSKAGGPEDGGETAGDVRPGQESPRETGSPSELSGGEAQERAEVWNSPCSNHE